jgi:hypothetical protein
MAAAAVLVLVVITQFFIQLLQQAEAQVAHLMELLELQAVLVVAEAVKTVEHLHLAARLLLQIKVLQEAVQEALLIVAVVAEVVLAWLAQMPLILMVLMAVMELQAQLLALL